MKLKMPFVPLLLVLAFLAGCESPSFSERLAEMPPQVQVVEGDVETVYHAAQRTFRRLDFVVVRATMGRIEAASAINRSETFADARQIVARVRIVASEPGKSEVQVSLSEEVSSASVGGTRQRSLREHSFFQTYFAMLQQVLQEKAAEAAAEKN